MSMSANVALESSAMVIVDVDLVSSMYDGRFGPSISLGGMVDMRRLLEGV